MSEALYNLAITRHSSSKSIEKLVQDLLEIMEETGDAYLEYKLSESLLFEQSSNTILENITWTKGEHYQQLFLEQKVETELHRAPPVRKRKLKRTEDSDSDPFNPDPDGTELPHEAAPNKSGIKKKTLTAVAIANITAVLVTGAVGYFVFEKFNKNTEQEAQYLTGNTSHNATIGIKGKDAPLSQTNIQNSTVQAELANTTTEQLAAASLSPQQLEALTSILKSTETKAFGHTDNDQYAKLLPRLKRLLALDKPSLGLVFAENGDHPYAAALLIMTVANSEQQKKRNLHHDDILLTMKSVAINADSEQTAPLLASVLSQIYTMTGDAATAKTLLKEAITEAENTADTPEQSIQWLTRMLIDHKHFNHSTGAEKLIDKLESIAGNTPTDTPEGQLTISSIYSHLAAISLNHGNITDATAWLKKIPIESTREHLQAYLHNI